MGLVIDTSVYVDAIIAKSSERHENSKEILKQIAGSGVNVFEPKMFIVELAGVLSRFKAREKIEGDVLSLAKSVRVLGEDKIFELALSIAFDTSCRAADAYFIATAKLTDSILITNDKLWRVMLKSRS